MESDTKFDNDLVARANSVYMCGRRKGYRSADGVTNLHSPLPL